MLWDRIPSSLTPSRHLPSLHIYSVYFGASPLQMEQNIGYQMREQLSSLPGLEDIESFAVNGKLSLSLRYAWGQDMQHAWLELNEKVDKLRNFLPDDLAFPVEGRRLIICFRFWWSATSASSTPYWTPP